MSDDLFNQGKLLIDKTKKKIDKILNIYNLYNKEGFDGAIPSYSMLGDPNTMPNTMDKPGGYNIFSSIDKNNLTEQTALDTASTDLKSKITNYNTSYSKLKDKRLEYLGNTDNYGTDRNYNVFVNRLSDIADIKATEKGCYKASVNGPRFDKAIIAPTTFASEDIANNACIGIASDMSMPYYAITKNSDNSYSCLTSSNGPVDNSIYTVSKVSSILKSSDDATLGGLFKNGQFGVYNPDSTIGDANNSKNVVATPIPAGFSCDIWNGGGIMKNNISATYGKICSTVKLLPKKVKKVIVKATPNNSDAWLQFSQIAVYAYVGRNAVNVAPRTFDARNIVEANSPNGYYRTDKYRAIDGVLQARNWWQGIYHSGTPSSENTWTLILGKEYDVFRIVYYNRSDCCRHRTAGMTITLKDAADNIVSTYTLDRNSVQSFDMT